MLLSQDQALLLVIDVQEKLLSALPGHQALLQRLNWLVALARDFELPIVFSEQYPRGLGHSMPKLLALAPNAPVVEKVHFSCVAAGCLPQEVQNQQQWILCGMESHVCVLQTALELLAAGKQVFVVADAIGARHSLDHELGIARMREAGAIIVSREMVLFELLRQAAHPRFKEMSQRYLQGEQP